MSIIYKVNTELSQDQVAQLFLSIHWLSGQYPQRLIQALRHSSLVITAWDGDKLVGLIRALDDGCMTAFIHYLLVHPDYQGLGIAARLLNDVKAAYTDYLYINIMPEESKNAGFYTKHGFQQLADGVAMQIKHNI